MTSSVTTIAHLSDLHLTEPHDFRWQSLSAKQLFAWLSWRRKRRFEHRREILEAVVADLRRLEPTHVVITGDLTQLGLPAEFRATAAWLPRIGESARITLVPGNHDISTATPLQETLYHWRHFLSGKDGTGAWTEGDARSAFPTVRILDGHALIGLCSALPTPLFFATGAIGSPQLLRLEHVLERTGHENLCRILVMHHPPVDRLVGWRKRLVDSGALHEVLARQGAELILHGHAHRASIEELAAGPWRIPLVGVPSASACGRHKRSHRAAYNLYRLSRGPIGWKVELSVRRLSDASNVFLDDRQVILELPPSPRRN